MRVANSNASDDGDGNANDSIDSSENSDNSADSADNSNDDNDDDASVEVPETANISESQQQELAQPLQGSVTLKRPYKFASAGFGGLGALMLLHPSRYGRVKLASKLGGAAGYGIAAGICNILSKDCGLDDQMKTDTFRRLNLGTLGFCALGLAAMPAESSFASNSVLAGAIAAAMTITRLFGLHVTIRGWFASRQHKSVVDELLQGMDSNVNGLKVKHKVRAQTYRNALLLVLVGMFSTFQEGLHNLSNQDYLLKTAFEISLQFSGVARLFLISSVIYSLKAAAEQDDLAQTKYIQMNFMIAIWAFLVGISQKTTSFEIILFGLMFAIKGYKGKRQKDGTLHVIEDASTRLWKKPTSD